MRYGFSCLGKCSRRALQRAFQGAQLGAEIEICFHGDGVIKELTDVLVTAEGDLNVLVNTHPVYHVHVELFDHSVIIHSGDST